MEETASDLFERICAPTISTVLELMGVLTRAGPITRRFVRVRLGLGFLERIALKHWSLRLEFTEFVVELFSSRAGLLYFY